MAEDFENYTAAQGTAPDGYAFYGIKDACGPLRGEGNPYGTGVDLKIVDAALGNEATLAKEFAADSTLTGKVIFDFDVKVPDQNKNRFIEIRDSAGKQIGLASLTYDKLTVNKINYDINPGEWNRISLAVDFTEDHQIATVYVNGAQVATDVDYNMAGFADVKLFRIRQNLKAEATVDTDLATWIDNLRIYSGTELKSMEDLKGSTEPEEPEIPEELVVHVAEDFEEYNKVGDAPFGFLFYGAKTKAGALKSDLTEPYGTSVALRIEETETNGEVTLAKNLADLSGKLIFDFDVKALDTNGTTFIEVKNASSTMELGRITNKNHFQVGSAVDVPLNVGEWYRISFAVDIKDGKQTATIYLNGVEQTSGHEYNKADFNDVNLFRIRSKRVTPLTSGLEGNNFTTLVDNVRIYTGTELKTMDELKDANLPDSLMGFDNELNLDMGDRLSGALTMVVNSRNILFDNVKSVNALNDGDKPCKRDSQILVPLAFAAKQFGMTVNVDTAAKTATAQMNGKSIQVTADSVKVDGDIIAETGILFTDDDVLIPLEAVGTVLGKKTYSDYKGRGLIVIGDKEKPFDDALDVVDENVKPEKNEKFYIEEAIKKVVYERPSGNDAIARLLEKNAAHPRVLATQDDFARVKQLIANGDPTMTKWYADILKQGEKHLEMAVVTDVIEDGRRMKGSRQVGPLVVNLSMLYHLSDDEVKKAAYKDRIWREVEAVCGFPSWNETNEFLNTAEFMEGLAIAYDWMYDEWTPEQRTMIETALINKGLIKSLEAYNNNVWWIHTYPRANNWNAVCNGAATTTLMAIGDIEREITLPSKEVVSMQEFGGKILDIGFNALENYLFLEFTPDGAWSEGPSYWSYTLEYLVKFMSSLETALDTCYGYDQTPGLDKTAYFPIFLSGPVGALNYGDASSGKVMAKEELWVARKYGDRKLASIHLDNMTEYKRAGSEFEMLWYEPDSYIPNQVVDLDQYFGGTEVATFRSKWKDSNAAFLGLKAGNNVVSHGHYDLGSFVFEALGQQWAIDLGKDDYNLPGYSEYEKGRLNYYRLNPQGHNTLVINPGADAQQNIKGFAKIEKTESKDRGGFAITNLTDAYKNEVESARRGVMLASNRTRATVQDEVTLKAPSTAYWFMHTKAEIEVSADGKSAVMTSGGEKLWVGLDINAVDGSGAPVEAVFDVMDAKPLPGTPNPAKQDPNTGIRKLFVKAENVKEMTLTVTMIPIIGSLEETNKDVTVKALDEWIIQDGKLEIPMVDSVTMDGEAMENFRSDTFSYSFGMPLNRTKVPVIDCVYDKEKYTVQIIPAKEVPGTTKLMVTSLANPEIKSIYDFNFRLVPPEDADKLLVEIPVESFEVSDYQKNPLHEGKDAFDNDYNTYWGAEGDQWLLMDFGKTETVNSIGIAFIKGNERSFKFDVETSLDGENWYKAYSGASSGESLELEKVYVRQHEARYVRITGHGNSVNNWNSYAEVRVYKLPAVMLPDSIEVVKNPDKVTYNIGEEFDAAGMEVALHLKDASGEKTETRVLTADEYEVIADLTKAGSCQVIVRYTYAGSDGREVYLEDTVDVTVVDPTRPTDPTEPTEPEEPGNPDNPGDGGNDDGNLIKDAEIAPGAPNTVLNNSREELLGSNILTEAEKKAVEAGATARIWIAIAPLDVNTIPKETVDKIESKAKEAVGKNAPITYFDISLWKQVAGFEKGKVAEPGMNVSLSMIIPENLRNKDASKKRTYYVLKEHGGVISLIEGTFNADTHEFRFETDSFSTYAIVYKDEDVTNNGGGNNYTPSVNGNANSNRKSPLTSTYGEAAIAGATAITGVTVATAAAEEVISAGGFQSTMILMLIFMAAIAAYFVSVQYIKKRK